jgi:hypothetical protein
MVAEVEAVEEDDTDLEVGERAAEPRRELRASEGDEAARDAALRDRTLPRPRGQGIERAVVLAGRDPDRDRLQGAGVERITARGVGEAREGELVAVNTPGAEPGDEDAAPAERDLARRLAMADRRGGRGWGCSSARRAARDPVPSSYAAPAGPCRGRGRRTRCAYRREHRAAVTAPAPWRRVGTRRLPGHAILCDSSSSAAPFGWLW